VTTPDLRNTPDAWSSRALTCETSLEAVGWTAASQLARFQAVLDALEPRAGDRLLDYGCGTGALTEHLPEGVTYLGYDWAKGMVARARAEHAEHAFTDHGPLGQYDLVALIGPFNLPGNWSKQHTWHTLRHLWDTTGCRRLALSLYAGNDERCLQYTEHEVASHGASLSYYARLERWRHNDLLLTVSREPL